MEEQNSIQEKRHFCSNCHSSFISKADFCHNCDQKNTNGRLTVKEKTNK